jgi:hypothetical protein
MRARRCAAASAAKEGGDESPARPGSAFFAGALVAAQASGSQRGAGAARSAGRRGASGAPPAPAAVELPPVESLTFGSDFTPFLRPEVDDQVRRAALKQLFRDPRFNIMDGLDTYIDDYTQADPIAPDVLADLLQRGFGALPDARGDAADGTSAAAAGPVPRDVAESTPPADSVASLSPAQSLAAVPSAQEHPPAPPEAKLAEGEAKQSNPADKAP